MFFVPRSKTEFWQRAVRFLTLREGEHECSYLTDGGGKESFIS